MEVNLQALAQILVQNDLLDSHNAFLYQKSAMENKEHLLSYLVKNNILDSQTMASKIAAHFNVSFLNLDNIDVSCALTDILDKGLIQHYRMVPLSSQNNQLSVATDDPSQYHAFKEIQFHTGLRINPVVVETQKLNRFINQILSKNDNKTSFDLVELLNSNKHIMGKPSEDEEPVVKFVNQLLINAIEIDASDIHFEPYEHDYRIRYRQDGLLHVIATPPHHLSTRIAARIKIMANLDISEKRTPQDGRFEIECTNKQKVDFRVSTCPTATGEKIVVRVLNKKSEKINLDTLGFNVKQKTLFYNAINCSQGMILITGPTGSGKTMTLYSALDYLNTNKKNICTVEDPVEVKIHGINQVPINAKCGLTFTTALRTLLRQDPDVIMIGEIRDLETADIAIKAAQTGHIVLSTLHTKNTTETLLRLENIGLSSFNIATAVTMIIAQRLIRRLCEKCKLIRNDLTQDFLVKHGLSNQELNLNESYKAHGCTQCHDGYRGRVAIFEVMPISKNILQMMISKKKPSDVFQEAQREGLISLFQSGIEKVQQGMTSIEEIMSLPINPV